MLEFLDPNRLCVRACGFGHEIDLRLKPI